MSRTSRIRCSTENIGKLQAFVEAFGREHGLARSLVLRLNLVLEELFTNTIRYGHDNAQGEEVEISLKVDQQQLVVCYRDGGRAFNPLAEAPAPDLHLAPDDRPIGGLGVHFIKSFTSASDYRRNGNRNELTMMMPLSAKG